MRCRAPRGIEGVERLGLRVDADVRVVLQHPARQVAAYRFQHVIGDAHLRQLGDDGVAQIMEPEPWQVRGVTQRAPGGVPLQHWVGGVIAAPLTRQPEIVLGLGMSEEIRSLEHARRRFDGRCVERDDAMARLVLAPSHVHEPLDQIHIAAAKVLHLDRPHRRVGGDDGCAIHVLPLRVRRGRVEETLPLLWRQCATDRTLALGQILHVIRERAPSAAELQHPRQHADIHVDRAVRLAGIVTRVLEVGDRCRGDRRERHVAEVLLDDTEPLFLEFDRASRAPDPFGTFNTVDRLSRAFGFVVPSSKAFEAGDRFLLARG